MDIDGHGTIQKSGQRGRLHVLDKGDDGIRIEAAHIGEQLLVHGIVDTGLEQQGGEPFSLERRRQRIDLLAFPVTANVRHDNADQMRAAADQSAGGAVGSVVELLDNAQDQLALGGL